MLQIYGFLRGRDKGAELSIVSHNVVYNLLITRLIVQFGKELAGALDLGVLDALELQGRQRALGLGDEVDVLDSEPSREGDRPVGVVVADRGRDEEPARQLGVDDDLVAGVELRRRTIRSTLESVTT